jgi:nucleoside-diphosphate-sugar epimerase
MNILITGAGGFLGRHLLNQLGKKPDVRLFRFSSSAIDADLPNVETTRFVDFADFRGNHLDWSGDLDVIIHLAQSRHYRDFPRSALHIHDVNVRSTLLLLDLGRRKKIKKFIHASSGSVYNPLVNIQPYIESQPVLPPDDFYARSKYTSELLVNSYSGFFSIHSLRFFFLYGPVANGMLIARLIDAVRGERPIILNGAGGLRINPCHVEDAAAAIQALLDGEAESGVYNIAGPEVVELERLATLIGDHLGKPPIFERQGGTSSSCIADIAKARTKIPFEPIRYPAAALEDILREQRIEAT